MILFDIEIRHPTTNELIFLAGFVIFVTVLGYVGYALEIFSNHIARMFVSAASIGGVLSSFGVSLIKHGWRAAVIYFIVASIAFAAMTSLNIL